MRPGRFLEWLAETAIRRPRSALVLALLGCLALAAPALTLKLDVDLVRLLPEGSPAVARFHELADSFGASDQAFVAIEISDASQRERAGEVIDGLADALLAARWTPPGAAVSEPLLLACDGRGDPRWTATLLDQVGVETWRLLDDRRLDLLIKRLEPRVLAKRLALGPPPDLPVELADRDLLAVWRDCFLPFWQERMGEGGPVERHGGHLVAQGGRFHLLVLRPAHPAYHRAFTQHFTTVLSDLAARVAADPAHAGLTIHTAGGHFIAAADYRSARSAALGNLWQGIAGVALLLALGFRSWRVPMLVAVTLLPATAAAYGAARLLCGPEVSLVVAGFTAALIGLGDDVLIHLLSAFGRHLGGGPCDRPARMEAARGAAHELAGGIFAGIATTVAAIAVLGLSDFRGLRQLGAMAAAGLAIILVQLFVVVPAVLVLWGWRVRQPSGKSFARRVPAWRWPLLALLALLAAGTVAILADGPLVRFDSRARSLRPTHDPLFDRQRQLGEKLGLPVDQVQFLITGDTREAVAETGALLRAAAEQVAVPQQLVVEAELGAALPASVTVTGALSLAGPRILDTPAGRMRVDQVKDGRLNGLRWLDGPPLMAVPSQSRVTVRPLLLTPSDPLSLAAPARQRAVRARLRNEVDWAGVEAVLAQNEAVLRSRHARFLADLASLRAGLAADRALTPGDLLDSPLGSALAGVWSERHGTVRLALRLSAPDVGHGLNVGELCAALGVARDGGMWGSAGAQVAATGIPVLSEALGEALVSDLRRLAGWAGFAVVTLVLLLVGGIRPALAVLAALLTSALLTLAGTEPGIEAVQVAYINPETGADCQKILGFSALMLRPGERLHMAARSSAMVFHQIEGGAEIAIEGHRFVMDEADTCCIPGYVPVTLLNRHADQPAFIFIADDAPLQKKLGVYEIRN